MTSYFGVPTNTVAGDSFAKVYREASTSIMPVEFFARHPGGLSGAYAGSTFFVNRSYFGPAGTPTIGTVDHIAQGVSTVPNKQGELWPKASPLTPG